MLVIDAARVAKRASQLFAKERLGQIRNSTRSKPGSTQFATMAFALSPISIALRSARNFAERFSTPQSVIPMQSMPHPMAQTAVSLALSVRRQGSTHSLRSLAF